MVHKLVAYLLMAAICLSSAFADDATTCNPTTNECGNCTVSVTYSIAPAVEGVCEGQKRILITVKMVCGAATCTREKYVCQGSNEAFNFACEGSRYNLTTTCVNWGQMEDGTCPCSNGKVKCGTV